MSAQRKELKETIAMDDKEQAENFVYQSTPQASPTKARRKPKQEKLTTLNIKVSRSQQRWLLDTAQQVRDNNETAVPPDQRVYPQHLIQTAIALLQQQDIDWSTVKNVDDLKDRLNL